MANYSKLMQDALKKLEIETEKKSKKQESRKTKVTKITDPIAAGNEDSYSDEDDAETLIELTRCEGYWRECWGVRPFNVDGRIAKIREFYEAPDAV